MSRAPLSSRSGRLLHPTRLVVLLYLAATAVGTALLLLPVATEDGRTTSFLDALFTSVSAISVTGLAVVDTGGHWTGIGELIIAALVQLGGFGITTLASLFTILVFRRIGLRSRLVSEAERSDLGQGDIGRLLRQVALFTLAVEAVGLVLLSAGFLLAEGGSPGDALWFGAFHSVTAFNNAGFSTLEGNLVGLARDPFLLSVLGALIVVGGIGFPVVLDLVRTRLRPRRWSLHTKLTLVTTGALLAAGAALVLAAEWANDATIATLPFQDRLANGLFASVTARTAGFNTFDYGLATEPTLLVTGILMFIGGGAASSAGGIKVTTFALLAFVIWAETRGDPDVTLFGRRIGERTIRQALAVALTAVGLATAATLAMLALTDLTLAAASFEVLSALGTVGLSTGDTGDRPAAAQVLLIGLMLVGRLGTLTIGTALVLRTRDRLFRYPEGRPLIG